MQVFFVFKNPISDIIFLFVVMHLSQQQEKKELLKRFLENSDSGEEKDHRKSNIHIVRSHTQINKSRVVSFNLGKVIPMQISHDKESLYDENLKLKVQMKHLQDQNLKLKTRINVTQKQKQSIVQNFSHAELEQPKSESKTTVRKEKIRITDSIHKQNQMKRMLRDSQQQIQNLKNQNAKMKKTIKYTQLNQLTIENECLTEECSRLEGLLGLGLNLKNIQNIEAEIIGLKSDLKISKDNNKNLLSQLKRKNEEIQRIKLDNIQNQSRIKKHNRSLIHLSDNRLTGRISKQQINSPKGTQSGNKILNSSSVKEKCEKCEELQKEIQKYVGELKVLASEKEKLLQENQQLIRKEEQIRKQLQVEKVDVGVGEEFKQNTADKNQQMPQKQGVLPVFGQKLEKTEEKNEQLIPDEKNVKEESQTVPNPLQANQQKQKLAEPEEKEEKKEQLKQDHEEAKNEEAPLNKNDQKDKEVEGAKILVEKAQVLEQKVEEKDRIEKESNKEIKDPSQNLNNSSNGKEEQVLVQEEDKKQEQEPIEEIKVEDNEIVEPVPVIKKSEQQILKETMVYKLKGQRYEHVDLMEDLKETGVRELDLKKLHKLFKNAPFQLNEEQIESMINNLLADGDEEDEAIGLNAFFEKMKPYFGNMTLLDEETEEQIEDQIQKKVRDNLTKLKDDFKSMKKSENNEVNRQEFENILKGNGFSEEQIDVALSQSMMFSQDIEHINYEAYLKGVLDS